VRYVLALLLCLLIFNRFGGWLTRHGFGRLPGDLRIRVLGREVFVPFGSGALLFLVACAIAWIR